MKRAVPILIFILILILSQAQPGLIEDQSHGCCSSLHELNLLITDPGLGWVEIIEKDDPGLLSPVFEAFQNEDRIIFSEAAIRPIRSLSHCFTNPLLIDRPPPICKHESINFA